VGAESEAGESALREEARRWLAAASEAPVRSALEAIFDSIGEAIAARRPRCEASGRCCRFEAYAHRLYVTGLEAAYTLSMLRPAEAGRASAGSGVPLTIRGGGTGCPETAPPMPAARPTRGDVEAAFDRGDCPLLVDGLCGAHAVKPIACRTYFCDERAQSWVIDLTERTTREIKDLHEAHGIPYIYAEWRSLLEAVIGEMD